MPKYQTLTEFLREPFGRSDDRTKLEKYNKMYLENDKKIILNSHTKIENAYYFHVKIPSNTHKEANLYYDVIIRFFTDSKDSLRSSHIRDYYIQFFSNSPGFIYKYAAVYQLNGFLIEALYKKLDPRFINKLPEKTNSKLELSYDKSIYFACRFLNERKFRVLNKFGIPLGRSLSPKKFFSEIKDFQSIKIETDILNLEKKSLNSLTKELESKVKSEKDKTQKELDDHKKHPQKSTTKNKRTAKPKKIANKSTSTTGRVIKKVARKSTFRR